MPSVIAWYFTRLALIGIWIDDFDATHSQDEERWFTLGLSSEDKLLAIAHTYQSTDISQVRGRIISARQATRREREQYENEPR